MLRAISYAIFRFCRQAAASVPQFSGNSNVQMLYWWHSGAAQMGHSFPCATPCTTDVFPQGTRAWPTSNSPVSNKDKRLWLKNKPHSTWQQNSGLAFWSRLCPHDQCCVPSSLSRLPQWLQWHWCGPGLFRAAPENWASLSPCIKQMIKQAWAYCQPTQV